jgi:hypothetical protein
LPVRTQAMGKSELLSQPGCLSLTDNYFFKTTMSIADEDAGSGGNHGRYWIGMLK